jgi:glyoxylase I family protein
MSSPIKTEAINHLVLTVTDVKRSVDWYRSLLGFEVALELGQKVILSNGSAVISLAPPPHPNQAIPNDRFNENRVGLDHLSFTVPTHAELEAAARLFDERGVSHGEIKDLGPGLAMYVMAFRDPDNVQLELAAPYSR